MFKQKVLSTYCLAMSKGIRKDEIPPEYKNLPVIGRGNTSIVLEKDADSVIMLTRDDMKKDWLHFGIEISKGWKFHDVGAKNKHMDQFGIFAIELPKLHKVDASNREKVNKEVKFFEKAMKDCKLNNSTSKEPEGIEAMRTYYEENGMSESMIAKLLDFLSNYNASQYSWDIARRQFLQDSAGNLFLIDPIINAELVKAMFTPTKTQYPY